MLNFVMNECPPISQNTGTLLTLISARECLSAPRLIKSQTDSARALREETGPWVTSGPCLRLTLYKTLECAPRLREEPQVNEALVHSNYQTINHRIARNLLLLFEFCILCISALQIDKLQIDISGA